MTDIATFDEAPFDITTQAVEETATIHLKNADGELLYADTVRKRPVQIVIYGPGSEAYGLMVSRQSARQAKRYNDNDGRVSPLPFEDHVRETAEDLAAITREFRNFAYPPATGATGAKLFAAVYADVSLGFIVAQVQKALKDWSAFRKGSGTS